MSCMHSHTCHLGAERHKLDAGGVRDLCVCVSLPFVDGDVVRRMHVRCWHAPGDRGLFPFLLLRLLQVQVWPDSRALLCLYHWSKLLSSAPSLAAVSTSFIKNSQTDWL